MALPASGPISMSMINEELGNSATQGISFQSIATAFDLNAPNYGDSKIGLGLDELIEKCGNINLYYRKLTLKNGKQITDEKLNIIFDEIEQQKELGPVSRGFRAMVTPVLDVLRPSRKQNVVGNMRPTGNALGKFSVSNNVIWNPADKLRTTIKEQTVEQNYSGVGYRDSAGKLYKNNQSAQQTLRENQNKINLKGFNKFSN
mgnify:CR=1 FL=1